MKKRLIYHPGRNVVFYHDNCGRVVFEMRGGEESPSCAIRVEDPASGRHREVLSMSLVGGRRFERHYGAKPGCLMDTLASLEGVELPRGAPGYLKRGVESVIGQIASGGRTIFPADNLFLPGVDGHVENIGSSFLGTATPEFLTGADDLRSDQGDRRQSEEDWLGLIEHLNSGNNT
jgi:hypothetical protein